MRHRYEVDGLLGIDFLLKYECLLDIINHQTGWNLKLNRNHPRVKYIFILKKNKKINS